MQISRQLPRKILQALRDMTQFGVLFPIEYALHRLLGRNMKIRISDFGNIEIRIHESDLDVTRQIFGLREYAIDKFPQKNWVSRRFEELCSAGVTPVIIDAGANIGASAIWFAVKYPEAKKLLP